MRSAKREGIIREGALVANVHRPLGSGERREMLYGPSRLYDAEEWVLDYFHVAYDGRTMLRSVSCLLPLGYERASSLGREGEEGPIHRLSETGVEFYVRPLEQCDSYLNVRMRHARPGERDDWDLQAVSWKLPSYFIIATPEHPLKAVAPSGREFEFVEGFREEDSAQFGLADGQSDPL